MRMPHCTPRPRQLFRAQRKGTDGACSDPNVICIDAACWCVAEPSFCSIKYSDWLRYDYDDGIMVWIQGNKHRHIIEVGAHRTSQVLIG